MALKEIVHQQMLFDQILLGILTLAFTAWAGVVWSGLKRVGDKFDLLRTELSGKTDDLRRDMMEHLLETEGRLTRLEAIVESALTKKQGKTTEVREKLDNSATIEGDSTIA